MRTSSERETADTGTGAPAHAPGRRTLTMGLAPAIQRRASGAREVDADPAPHERYEPAIDPFAIHLTDAPIQRRAAEAAPSAGPGRAMPADVRAKMETSMDADFSSVRIHEGPQASAVGALAFTQGTDIHFAPGRYDPHSAGGQELLGHELAHVVQQAQGRVAATSQAKSADGSVALNDDDALEREADEMGARAARGEVGRGGGVQATAHAAGPIQRFREYAKTPGDKGGGGGQGYGMVQKGGYHVKYHPLPGSPWNGKMWDEFHVTFELFGDDKKCPKVYFDDAGTRLAFHDGDRVNREYRSDHEGKPIGTSKDTYPLFADLILEAQQHAQTFLSQANGTAPRLGQVPAQQRVRELEERERELEERREKEELELGGARKEQDKKQSESFGKSYAPDSKQLSLFGSTSKDDPRDEILKSAGVERWNYAKIKNDLWDKPKSAWGEHARYYDAIKQEREKREPKPVIETTPTLEPPRDSDSHSNVETKPIVETKPLVETKPIVETKPMVETTPIVEPKAIVEPKPIVDSKPIVETPHDHAPPLTSTSRQVTPTSGEQVREVVQQSGVSSEVLHTLAKEVQPETAKEERRAPDQNRLVTLGIPMAVIMLILAIGLVKFFQLLG